MPMYHNIGGKGVGLVDREVTQKRGLMLFRLPNITEVHVDPGLSTEYRDLFWT